MIRDAQISKLGRYDEAVATFQQMINLRPDLTSYTRVSYARELYGDVPGAIDAMQSAAMAGAGRMENVAWTQTQLGNLSFNSGDLQSAKTHYEASLFTLDGYVSVSPVSPASPPPKAITRPPSTSNSQAIQTMPLPSSSSPWATSTPSLVNPTRLPSNTLLSMRCSRSTGKTASTPTSR